MDDIQALVWRKKTVVVVYHCLKSLLCFGSISNESMYLIILLLNMTNLSIKNQNQTKTLLQKKQSNEHYFKVFALKQLQEQLHLYL